MLMTQNAQDSHHTQRSECHKTKRTNTWPTITVLSDIITIS